MLQYIPKKPLTYLQREAAARQKQADRIEAWEDPFNTAMRRVRAALMAQSETHLEADRNFQRENSPVSAPRACGGGVCHPQRAAALAAFTAGWSDNAAEPIAPTMSREEHARLLGADADAELAAANAALQALYAERRAETLSSLDSTTILDLDDEAGDAVLDELPVPRGRGRPRLSDEA